MKIASIGNPSGYSGIGGVTVAACTASPNIVQGTSPPSLLRVIGTERLLCVEDTTLNSAPAKLGPAIRVNPPVPAEKVSVPPMLPAIPRIMSLAFEVDGIVTLIETEQKRGQPGVVPLFIAGDANEGSNGLTVFAPLILHTTNPIASSKVVVWTLTVTVAPERGVEAMAHHSATNPPPTPSGVDCLSVKLRPLAVGSPLKETEAEAAKTITTSFGLLVENPVTEHDIG